MENDTARNITTLGRYMKANIALIVWVIAKEDARRRSKIEFRGDIGAKIWKAQTPEDFERGVLGRAMEKKFPRGLFISCATR